MPILAVALLTGCAAPGRQGAQTPTQAPHLATEMAVMDDGYQLPLRHWGSETQARALVLALHGFNDYGNAFADLGPYLAHRGILTYAYDQRGFGASAQPGRWAGAERMIADLRQLTALLRERHPRLPLYLLGESMGGAVVMAAWTEPHIAAGIVLVAPAVWSRDTMNPIQRLVLWVAAHSLPGLHLTGEGLDIRPSDNLDMLRSFGADPLVIKETRVDALWGVTDLMDLAAEAAPHLTRPALVLYGEKDDIIPRSAYCAMVENLPRQLGPQMVLYGGGWHMLTRDLQGERVMADIAAWLADREGPLPSREEITLSSPRLERLCPGSSFLEEDTAS